VSGRNFTGTAEWAGFAGTRLARHIAALARGDALSGPDLTGEFVRSVALHLRTNARQPAGQLIAIVTCATLVDRGFPGRRCRQPGRCYRTPAAPSAPQATEYRMW